MKTPGPFQKPTSPLVGLRAHVEKHWSTARKKGSVVLLETYLFLLIAFLEPT